MPKTIIIGKNSNLSTVLSKVLENCEVISSREILKNEEILSKYKNSNINIIMNNFQPATQLNNLSSSSEYINSAIMVTAKVLDYLKESNINKIIYTSSSSVYGNNILCSEKDELKPMNLHASLKVANEKLIEKFCMENKIDYTIARVFNMYGGEDRFSIVSKIIKAYKNQEELTIVNNGNAVRDFIHISDVVNIYIKLLNTKNLYIVNIGTGNGISIKSILDFLKNQNIYIKVNNIFRNELKISTADNSLLLTQLGQYEFSDIESYLKKKLAI